MGNDADDDDVRVCDVSDGCDAVDQTGRSWGDVCDDDGENDDAHEIDHHFHVVRSSPCSFPPPGFGLLVLMYCHHRVAGWLQQTKERMRGGKEHRSSDQNLQGSNQETTEENDEKSQK